MAKIKVTSKCAIYDGMIMTFKAPCNCSAADGLNVYHQNVKHTFSFRDAHGNDVSNTENLFGLNVYVTVSLDTTNGYAYIQNADTNSYLESHINNTENPHHVTAEQVGAAPAGYGLGEYLYSNKAQIVDNFDNAKKTGWYSYFKSGTVINGIACNGGMLEVMAYNAERIRQIYYPNRSHDVFHRHCYDGVWGEWMTCVTPTNIGAAPATPSDTYPTCYYRNVGEEQEWINPPMVLGTEYRTTERWANRAVYTKLVQYGGMPGYTTYAYAHGCAATSILRYCAVNETLGITIPNSTTSIVVDKTNISLTTNTLDVKGNLCRVQIWYTKN